MRIFQPERNEYFQKYWRKNKLKMLQQKSERRKKLRKEIFDFFGNKCQICGFSNVKALQLDHINGGGTKERKMFRWEVVLAKGWDLMKNDPEKFKKKFQLLCANCNWIKR